jgi:DNA-binding transcriptional LysR family regulator
MTLTLKLLEQATALAATGHFAKAAERLGISQPTLSRNIAALEHDLGLKLFDRGRDGATLTVFGEVLTERGARVLNEIEALLAELQAVAGLDTGSLEIAAGPYAAEDPVATAVARLVTERPGLRVRVEVVSPDEVCNAVLAGRHDVGLMGRDSELQHERLVGEPLRDRRLLLACRPAHPLATTRPTVEQVLQFPLVTVFLQGQTAQTAAMHGRAGSTDAVRKGFAPAIEVNSFDAARRIAAASDALFPATASMLAAHLEVGQLVTLDFDIPVLRSRPALVRLRDRTPSPAAQRFIELVRELDAELPG